LIDLFLFLNIVSFQFEPTILQLFQVIPNNMICPTLQNKPLFRRWADLWWWISFLRIISSGLETRNNRRELNMLDAIRNSLNLTIGHVWTRALSWWNSTFFFAKWGRFFFKSYWNDSIRLRNNRHWLFASTEGNRWIIPRVSQKSLFRLTFYGLRWSWFIRRSPLFWLFDPSSQVWSNGSMFHPQ